MKSFRAFLIVLFSVFYISLNAQVFVGGNIGFTSASDKNTSDGSKTSNYIFSLTPTVGKFLSEKTAIGFALDISLSGNTSGTNPESITKSSSLGGSLFLRYYLIKWNKFSVFERGSIGLAFSNSTTKAGGSTTDGPKTNYMSLGFAPGLSYDINDKLSLQTYINLLNLGYTYMTTKSGTNKENYSSFNFGAGLNNIVAINAITIGAIYKF